MPGGRVYELGRSGSEIYRRVQLGAELVQREALSEVGRHRRFGGVTVAGFEGPDDRLVLAAEGGVAVVTPEAAGVDLMSATPTPEVVEEVQQDPVA